MKTKIPQKILKELFFGKWYTKLLSPQIEIKFLIWNIFQGFWYPISLGSKDFASCEYSNCHLSDRDSTTQMDKVSALVWRCMDPKIDENFLKEFRK